MLSGPVIAADRTAGPWPSASRCSNVAFVPIAFLATSMTLVWSTVSVPVALVRTGPPSKTNSAVPGGEGLR